MANGNAPVLRGRRWFWLSALTLLAGAVLTWFGKDVGPFAAVASAALFSGNATTVVGRHNYRPPTPYGTESDEP